MSEHDDESPFGGRPSDEDVAKLETENSELQFLLDRTRSQLEEAYHDARVADAIHHAVLTVAQHSETPPPLQKDKAVLWLGVQALSAMHQDSQRKQILEDIRGAMIDGEQGADCGDPPPSDHWSALRHAEHVRDGLIKIQELIGKHIDMDPESLAGAYGDGLDLIEHVLEDLLSNKPELPRKKPSAAV